MAGPYRGWVKIEPCPVKEPFVFPRGRRARHRIVRAGVKPPFCREGGIASNRTRIKWPCAIHGIVHQPFESAVPTGLEASILPGHVRTVHTGVKGIHPRSNPVR